MPVLSEKEVEKKFKAYKRKMIKILGRKATTDDQLTQLGKRLFGKRYIGTFSQDYKPQKKPTCQYFIINNQLKGQPGEHWIAVVKNGNTYYIYDSFARHAERLIPVF
jgi:hypothetical protein